MEDKNRNKEQGNKERTVIIEDINPKIPTTINGLSTPITKQFVPDYIKKQYPTICCPKTQCKYRGTYRLKVNG